MKREDTERLLTAEHRELEALLRAKELELEVLRLRARVSELEEMLQERGVDVASKSKRSEWPAWARGQAPEVATVSKAIVALHRARGTWSGTMSELLVDLQEYRQSGAALWPGTAHRLTRIVAQAAPMLAAEGVAVTRQGRSNRGPTFLVAAG